MFLMGGGIGVPPILQLAKEMNADKQIVVGYRDSQMFLKENLEQNGTVYVATEDGSFGTKGNVIELTNFRELFDMQTVKKVYKV